jgi:phosphopentomutase
LFLIALGLSEKYTRNISSCHRMRRVFEELDVKLPDIQKYISSGDLLVLTDDHGSDPTDQSTDHTWKYIPLLCTSTSGKNNVNLGVHCSSAEVRRIVR